MCSRRKRVAARVAHLVDAVAVDRRRVPARRPIDAADQVEQRRLAAARRADDRDVVAARDLERHAAHGVHELVAHVIVAANVARHDDRRLAHPTASSRSVIAIGSDAPRHDG